MDKKLTIILSIFIWMTCSLNPAVSYGFDSASSCNPKMSRKGRAQLLSSIPCDLTQQVYCNFPGISYPWHAVRRFVHENQGLMKRMYGDVRHISILRNEIQNNEIDVEDIAATAARYSRDGFRKIKYLHTEYQNVKTNDVLTEPHFRPTSTTSTTTTTTTQKTPETATPAHLEQVFNNVRIKNGADNNLESNNVIEASTSTSTIENIKVVQAPNLGLNKTESVTISTTLKVVQQIIKSEIESEQIDKQEIPESEIMQIPEKRNNERPNINQNSEKETMVEKIQQPTEKSQPDISTTTNESNNSNNNNNKGNELVVDKKKPNKPVNMESQLFQDTVQKDAPVVNMRGVNACPVKEEVVAPFWANNTRGEVLALLNLYPFEQYVHWEKCTQEHKQMYCRDGCRCEQQYRLHRLLAYDPHNECRGIFSDWFRFPSCCICKCYDIPTEFRATSRSPRMSDEDGRKGKYFLEKAEEEVRKAIYEHATKDWYRPKDEFDFYD